MPYIRYNNNSTQPNKNNSHNNELTYGLLARLQGG